MPLRRRRWVAVPLLLALWSCGSSDDAACKPAAPDPECPDLRFSGVLYDEWQAVDPPPVLQEIGDAVYPACNGPEHCGPDLGGFAATDVWLIEGIDTEQALMGYRQGTETHVVFVRRGTDPESVPGLQDAVQ